MGSQNSYSTFERMQVKYPISVHGSIDLVQLYTYNALTKATPIEQKKLEKLLNTINTVMEQYAKQHDDVVQEINKLRLEIRFVTKGTPVTEPIDSASSQPVLRSNPNFNEQQYNAYSELLKKAYRKVSMLAHPDKGG